MTATVHRKPTTPPESLTYYSPSRARYYTDPTQWVIPGASVGGLTSIPVAESIGDQQVGVGRNNAALREEYQSPHLGFHVQPHLRFYLP